jgi:hypothetical protein
MNTNIVGWIMLAIVILSNFAIIVKMYVKVTDFEIWKAKVELHLDNRQVHLDPIRDEQRWGDLTKRMDRMEKKLDNLSASERAIISKLNKGDSEDA